MRLEGKTAFVTGADSGIGRAIALTFAREGANVAIHSFGDQRGAEQTVHAIQNHGRRAEHFEVDFRNPANAEGMIQQVVNRLGQLDILVNNAGVGGNTGSSIDTPTDAFLATLGVDLVAPFILARDAAKTMASQGSGSIVNITSVHEEIPQQGGSAYCAAKGGLRMVTRCLALELAGKGVRINNIGPGMTTTPMTTDTLYDPEKSPGAVGRIPMGRPAEVQEIANVALFLASNEASYVNGSTYFVDGGLMQKIGQG